MVLKYHNIYQSNLDVKIHNNIDNQ